MAVCCNWAGWLPLQHRLVRSGAVEALQYVESLDPTKPGYDLQSLLLALLAKPPLGDLGRTVFDELSRPLRAELLLLLSLLLPRLPREPLRRLLEQFLGKQHEPTYGWDIHIAEELLFRLPPNDAEGESTEAGDGVGRSRSSVAAVTRSALYKETVASLTSIVAQERGGISCSWPALVSFGPPHKPSRQIQEEGRSDEAAPSPKRQRTECKSDAEMQSGVDTSDADVPVASTPAFALSQEPPPSQQIEWQMPTETPSRRDDRVGETTDEARNLSSLLFSQGASSTPPAAGVQRFVAAPPTLIPMQLQTSAANSSLHKSGATVATPVKIADVPPALHVGDSTVDDTSISTVPVSSEQSDAWAALSVAIKPLRTGIAPTAGSDSNELIERVVGTIEGARQHLVACIAALELSTLSDTSLLRVATGLLTQEQSFRIATEFIATAILPRISALSATASRALLAVCQLATTNQPKATQTRLLLPLLCESNMGSAQAELVLRSVKGKDGLSLPQIQALLEGALTKAPPPPWGDPLLHTWHSVLGLRLALPPTTILLPLLKLLEIQAADQQKSQKYCNILFALVSKYGPQLAATERTSIDLLERLLTGCTSFVRKPALTALTKLKRSL